MPKNPLLHLRRDYKHGGAPHKPILLLAVMELVEHGLISTNKIPITGELLLAFRAIWAKLVITLHMPNFALPFYHMKSEPFWKLITYEGKSIPLTSSNSIRSLSGLRESVAYALLDEAYFRAFADPVQREQIRNEMLAVYFPNTRQLYQTNTSESFLADYGQPQLEEPAAVYETKTLALLTTLKKEEREEETVLRGAVFKRMVPEKYLYRCAITGMQAMSTNKNIQLVDAFHIVPISQLGIDHISNGICLSPTLHRAIDRGLIAISDDYRVLVSPHLHETAGPYALAPLAGKRLLLPEQARHHPDPAFLRQHREGWLFR
jgi:putative restriction endonuclease